MKHITIIRHHLGLIIRIKQLPDQNDWIELTELIHQEKSKTLRFFWEFNRLNQVNVSIVEQLLPILSIVNNTGGKSVLVRSNRDLRQIIQHIGGEQCFPILDFLDEALFPERSAAKSKGEILKRNTTVQKQVELSSPNSPNSSIEEKQDNLIPRRSKRTNICLPFLFGPFANQEYMLSTWTGCVTEEIDIESFSGLGFFSQQNIQTGAKLNFIFPTLRIGHGNSDASKITIFSGRVKHTTPVKQWIRLGVALIDAFEFTGQFTIKEE